MLPKEHTQQNITQFLTKDTKHFKIQKIPKESFLFPTFAET